MDAKGAGEGSRLRSPTRGSPVLGLPHPQPHFLLLPLTIPPRTGRGAEPWPVIADAPPTGRVFVGTQASACGYRPTFAKARGLGARHARRTGEPRLGVPPGSAVAPPEPQRLLND